MFRKIAQQKAKGNFDKNSFLEYDEIENGGIYAFTWNPLQQPILTDPLGVSDWYHTQREFLTTLKGCSLRMFIEVSKKGRWHFHGFIKIIDRLRFSIYAAPKLCEYGASKMDILHTTDDYAKWLIYCNKQQNEMNDLLTEHLFCVLDKKALAQRNPDGVIAIASG